MLDKRNNLRRTILETVLFTYLTLTGCATQQTAEEAPILAEQKINQEKSDKKAKELEEKIIQQARQNQIISFGEDHGEKTDEEFVLYLLPQLKAEGFNYLALELNTSRQKMIDDFLAGKRNDAEIKKHFAVEMSMPLIKKANELGMKVIAYDYTSTDRTNFIKMQKDFLDGKIDSKGMHKIIVGNSCSNLREGKSFNNLKKIIFDHYPKAKVVIFAGSWHISENESVNVFDSYVKTLGRRLSEFTHNKHSSIALVDYCCELFDVSPQVKSTPQIVDLRVRKQQQINFVNYKKRNQYKTQHRPTRKQSR